MPAILCLNGPNLDRLGTRDPAVYGDWTLSRLEEQVIKWGSELGLDVVCHQSNHAGSLIEAIHAGDADGIVINPGGLTHSSPSLADAVASVPVPVVEVHLSNVRARDRWRRRSYISGPAVTSIVGRGPEGYRAALRHLVNRWDWPVETIRYGPHPDHVIDVRKTSKAAMSAILIHGGFWLDAWGRDLVDGWAVDLARRGVATAAIEYRRTPSGGGAVATTSDVVVAIDAGLGVLETTDHVVIGHSAGAHLAAWAASCRPLRPSLTVAISGIFDLAGADAAGVGGGAVSSFDPSHLTSPVGLPPPATPIALIHAQGDSVVPVAQSQAYHDHLLGQGADVSLDLVPGGHFDCLDTTSSTWAAVIDRLVPGVT